MLPVAGCLLGGFFGLVGHVLCCIGSILSSFSRRIFGCISSCGGGVTCSLGSSGGSFTRSVGGSAGCISSGTCRLGGRVCGRFCGFLSLFHVGGGGFFRFLTSGQRQCGEKCDEQFGWQLHGVSLVKVNLT